MKTIINSTSFFFLNIIKCYLLKKKLQLFITEYAITKPDTSKKKKKMKNKEIEVHQGCTWVAYIKYLWADTKDETPRKNCQISQTEKIPIAQLRIDSRIYLVPDLISSIFYNNFNFNDIFLKEKKKMSKFICTFNKHSGLWPKTHKFPILPILYPPIFHSPYQTDP